jgi:hypothetical protein
MHAAVRPYATTGIALVGASVIAVTPVAAPLPDVHIPTLRVPVALTQAANPYVQVFQDAVTNLQTILGTAATNPTPILTKIFSNQIATLQALLASLPTSAAGASAASTTPALTSPTGGLQSLLTAIQTALGQVFTALTTTVPPILQTALSDLTSANVEGAINNVLLAGLVALSPLLGLATPLTTAITAPVQSLVNTIDSLGPLATILANPLQNVVNVLNAVTANGNAAVFGGGLLGPLITGPAAVGAAIQGVINAIGGGNPTDILNAVVDAPAVILGGLLNGQVGGAGLGPDLAFLLIPGSPLSATCTSICAGGILNSIGLGTGFQIISPGVLSTLQALQKTIANALMPPAISTAGPLQLAKTAAPNTPSALPNVTANTVTVDTPAPHVAAPTVGSGPITKVVTPPTPTVNGNTNKVVGGNGTEVGGGLGKIAAGLNGGSGRLPKHAK